MMMKNVWVFLEACLHSWDTKNEILIKKKLLLLLHEFILPACTNMCVCAVRKFFIFFIHFMQNKKKIILAAHVSQRTSVYWRFLVIHFYSIFIQYHAW